MVAAAQKAAQRAREERLARLGPLVEMYGEGSELLRAVDRYMDAPACDMRVPGAPGEVMLGQGLVELTAESAHG